MECVDPPIGHDTFVFRLLTGFTFHGCYARTASEFTGLSNFTGQHIKLSCVPQIIFSSMFSMLL